MILHFQELIRGVVIVLSEVDVGDGIDHLKMIVRHLERGEDMMARPFLGKFLAEDSIRASWDACRKVSRRYLLKS